MPHVRTPQPSPFGPDQQPPADLSEDEIFDILCNRRRRQALHYLLQKETPLTVRELSRQIAAWENDIEPEHVSSDQRRRVYVALHQTHLPAMDDANVLDYESGDIELTEHAEDLQVYLDIVHDDELPWSEFYLGLGALSVSLVVTVWAGAYPFVLLPDLGWAGVIALAFTVVAGVHVYHAKQNKLGADGGPPIET